MKRLWKAALCIGMALAMVSACSPSTEEQPKVFAEMTQNLGPTPTPTTVADTQDVGGRGVFSSNPYEMQGGAEDGYAEGDPLLEEENNYGEESDDLYAAEGFYEDPYATVYPYAGSTPIPLDPVDMPPPTPRPELAFDYVPYSIASLGLTFEGPVGWIPDESQSGVFMLSEPESQMKDGQLGIIKIYASPLSADYSASQLKSEINQRLREISATNFDVWDPSLTATRHLMGANGVYANYNGTMANGIKVGGRIHSASLDRTLYTIEIVYPLEYREDFLNVFTRMRSTIKRQ